jgi:hypothetical protein
MPSFHTSEFESRFNSPENSSVETNTTKQDFELGLLDGYSQTTRQGFFPVQSATEKELLDALYSLIINSILPSGATNYLTTPVSNTFSHQVTESFAFDGKDTLSNYLMPDIALIKNLSREDKSKKAIQIKHALLDLKKRFGSDERVFQFILRSVATSAHIHSFASIHRFSHNNLSSDSLTETGRWCQLDSVEFESLVTEHKAACALFVKWLCYYNSFNETQLSTRSLISYFNHIFSQFEQRYVVGLLGLNPDEYLDKNFSKLSEQCVDEIKTLYSRQIVEHKVEALLTAFTNYFCLLNTKSSFQKLLFVAATESDKQVTTSSFVMTCAIKSLRKLVFTECFSQKHVKPSIQDVYRGQKTTSFTQLFNEYEQTARWLFDKQDTFVQCHLFTNTTLRCYFVPLTSSYVVEHFTKNHNYTFLNLNDLFIYVKSQSTDDFLLPGYCAWQKLLMLLSALQKIENTWR